MRGPQSPHVLRVPYRVMCADPEMSVSLPAQPCEFRQETRGNIVCMPGLASTTQPFARLEVDANGR